MASLFDASEDGSCLLFFCFPPAVWYLHGKMESSSLNYKSFMEESTDLEFSEGGDCPAPLDNHFLTTFVMEKYLPYSS